MLRPMWKQPDKSTSKSNYEHLFKVLLLGDSGVGKSCLLVRFCDNSYEENLMSTIGVDFRTKLLCVEDKDICLQIWDTAGQERYHSITSSYYKGAEGALVVYDISNRDTFNNVDKWVNEIRLANKNVTIILIGTKSDKQFERKVTHLEGENKSKELDCLFYEASSKLGLGVDIIFQDLTKAILNKSTKNLLTTEKTINLKSKPLVYKETEPEACC